MSRTRSLCCQRRVMRVAMCCSALQCVALCCNLLQCDFTDALIVLSAQVMRVAVCCSVLQCVADRTNMHSEGWLAQCHM